MNFNKYPQSSNEPCLRSPYRIKCKLLYLLIFYDIREIKHQQNINNHIHENKRNNQRVLFCNTVESPLSQHPLSEYLNIQAFYYQNALLSGRNASQ